MPHTRAGRYLAKETFYASMSRGCLHGARKISVAKAEQRFAGFTCRNFGPCGAQVEIRRISEESKMGPSALFSDFNNYLSAELLL